MIFFTADLHLGHKAMHGRSQFKSIEEHDRFIIDRWNSVVGEKDDVYIIGDMIWPKCQCNPLDYIDDLKGIKILVPGDHDHNRLLRINVPYSKTFGRRFYCKISNIIEIKYKEQSIIMSHWPQQHWRRSHYGSWHLYGHLHHGDVETGWGKRLQIGVDRWNYYPVSFDDVCEVMKLLPENPNLMRKNGN